MSPIDYAMLGAAVAYYRDSGYQYVEVPWTCSTDASRATNPTSDDCFLSQHRDGTFLTRERLVASAEQSLLDLGLEPGRYAACTPCFRYEREGYNFHTRPGFMKVELFVTDASKSAADLVEDAMSFMDQYVSSDDNLYRETTDIGYDLMLNGIEVGSYGVREGFNQRWVYGTGLALPRFQTARAARLLL
jgi:seryl-tRNA synthetase